MRTLAVSLVLPFLLAPAGAFAGGALETGLARFEDLDYEAAIPHLERALDDGALPEADRARAAAHLAVIHVAFGDEDRARTRVTEALTLDPEVDVPAAASPHIRELFDTARASLDPRPGAAGDPEVPAEQRLLVHTPPPPGTERTRIEVSLDPTRQVDVDRLVMHHRIRGEAIWFDVVARAVAPGVFAAELPAPRAEGTPVEYYLEAFDRVGQRIGQLGSAATPLVYGPPAPEGVPVAPDPHPVAARPFYQQWWFLGGTGAVVTAGIVGGVILATGSREPGCGAASGLGCIRVEVD